MKPILLSRSEINDDLWDELIAKSRNRVVYAFSWYLDLVCENWMAMIWPSTQDYQVVIPLPVRRKLGIDVLYQPVLCQFLGIFSVNELSRSETAIFLNAVNKRFCYISGYHFHPDHFDIISKLKHQFRDFMFFETQTFWLPLSESISSIQAEYSRDRKTNLKRSRKFDWEIVGGENPATMIEIFRKFHQQKIGGGVSESTYLLLIELFQILFEKAKAELIQARLYGKIHAAILLVHDGNKIIYLFNAADEIGRKGNARTFILDKVFERYSESRLTFDFESPPKTDISSHYKSFGGIPKHFYCISKNKLPTPFRQLQNLRKRLKTN